MLQWGVSNSGFQAWHNKCGPLIQSKACHSLHRAPMGLITHLSGASWVSTHVRPIVGYTLVRRIVGYTLVRCVMGYMLLKMHHGQPL
eukprot:771285-Pelagomonas_calceolata.AAC.2